MLYNDKLESGGHTVIKTIIVILLFAVLFSLGSALIYLVRDKGQSKRTLSALTWRIGLSILVFVLLMIAFSAGLIQPHGVIY